MRFIIAPEFHEQMLQFSRDAVRSTEPMAREISGTTFPIARSSIPQAKQLIRKFQADLCDLLLQEGADEVYQLEVAFFPLTQKREGRL